LLDEPPPEIWLFNRPATVARMPPPESAASEWCGQFVLAATSLDMAVAGAPVFYVGGSPYANGRVRYNADGTYDARIGRNGTYGLRFSTACMRQYGSQLTCQDIQQPLQTKANNPSLSNVRCLDGEVPGSCDCFFDLNNTGRTTGVYSVSGNLITHRPLRPIVNFPSDAVFCAQGDSLQLSGARSTSLFDKPGLRTLDLWRINCDDGAQGAGEDGVDCGLMCDNLCPGQMEPEPLP
jgi:hypothetical protein